MNILILTGRFGMGHIKAAEAIKENILKEENNKAEIIDFMDYMFPTMSRGIYTGFNFLVSKCSGLYNSMNKSAGKFSTVPLKTTVTSKIDKLIKEYQADAIVVTFPVCNQYISAYKRMRQRDIPLYTYITDITAHEEWLSPRTDRYFVGDMITKNTLISRGVEESRISVTGIPVRKQFHKDVETRVKESKKDILIMGGGLGLIPSSGNLLKKLNKREDINVTVIAGRNCKLEKMIRSEYSNLKAVGYTDRVDEYMKKADLIVSKAGGITTFEAIASKTPLYIIRPFLEQELGNARYIEEHNIGRVLWDEKVDETDDIIEFIGNDELLMTMKENMAEIEKQYEKINVYGNGSIKKCS